MTHSFPTRRSSDLEKASPLDAPVRRMGYPRMRPRPPAKHRTNASTRQNRADHDGKRTSRNETLLLPKLALCAQGHGLRRSEEHTSELQSLMRISYAVFCLKNTNTILCITQK